MILPINFLTPKHTLNTPAFKAGATLRANKSTGKAYDTFEKTNASSELQRGQFLINGQIFVADSTEMFRSDINWGKFGDYIKNKFKGEDNVNTYIYGCSDGSEAYTMSILLQKMFNKEADRFFPIIAKDISEDKIQRNIEEQEAGGVERYKQAYIKAKVGLGLFGENEIEQYMEKIDTPFYISDNGAVLKKKVIEPVEFKQANILDDIENIDSTRPSIIMARNMWPYVESGEYKKFAKELYQRLKEGSVVVIGDFDYARLDSVNFPTALTDAGFKPAKTNISTYEKHPLIFEKRPQGKLIPFMGRRGEVLGGDGKVFNGNTTYMFRGDLNWKTFGNFLMGRFGEYDRVNVYNYAASKGYEPYSLSILLQTKFKDEAEKFFPIMAKDIDAELIAENILKQKLGRVEAEEGYDRAQRVLRADRDELLTFMKPDIYLYDAELLKKATKPVKFSHANILEDIKNIDSSVPSLVMARNMWPYVNKDEYEDFAKRLYDRLSPGSVVVVGDFDYATDENFPPYLIKAGFQPLIEDDRYNLIFLRD